MGVVLGASMALKLSVGSVLGTLRGRFSSSEDSEAMAVDCARNSGRAEGRVLGAEAEPSNLPGSF